MLTVFEADYLQYKSEIRHIRNRVFVVGQKVPEDIEIDGKDEGCFHVLLTKNDEPAGTGRMEKDGHIGRIAVLEEYRGMDFGTMIMHKLEDIARSNGIGKVYLNSQCHAVNFYLKLGYDPVGDTFYEAGIEHIKMVKVL